MRESRVRIEKGHKSFSVGHYHCRPVFLKIMLGYVRCSFLEGFDSSVNIPTLQLGSAPAAALKAALAECFAAAYEALCWHDFSDLFGAPLAPAWMCTRMHVLHNFVIALYTLTLLTEREFQEQQRRHAVTDQDKPSDLIRLKRSGQPAACISHASCNEIEKGLISREIPVPAWLQKSRAATH